MKVIIDIPNEIFSDISKGYTCQEYADELINLVKNGIPLDKIRAEIGAMSGDIETIADVLVIIDKYREGK